MEDPAATAVQVWGRPVDAQTRCVHWSGPFDIVAVQFVCCRRFYPCHTCHEQTADHPGRPWPAADRDRRAVLCGVCRARARIGDYLAAPDACGSCGARFNPGCRTHHHLYFT